MLIQSGFFVLLFYIYWITIICIVIGIQNENLQLKSYVNYIMIMKILIQTIRAKKMWLKVIVIQPLNCIEYMNWYPKIKLYTYIT